MIWGMYHSRDVIWLCGCSSLLDSNAQQIQRGSVLQFLHSLEILVNTYDCCVITIKFKVLGESYMKRIDNINPTLINIHTNQLKILHVHTKESCTEKSGNINPNLINTHTPINLKYYLFTLLEYSFSFFV